MSRLRIIAIALVALASVAVTLVARPASAAAPRLLEISRDQYDNPDSQHQTEVEPDTFAYGDSVLAAFQTGRFFDGGSSNIGWAFSRDAGATWARGFLPSITVNSVPRGAAFRASDPSVAYDRVHNTWMISSLTLFGVGNGVVVSRSPDGVHWSDPVTATGPVTVNGPSGADKEWIVCDNGAHSRFAGTCYVVWDDVDTLGAYMSKSRDGGVTWSGPLPRGVVGFALQPGVLPDGRLVIVHISPRGGIYSSLGYEGGVLFTLPIAVTDFVAYHPSAGLRTPPLPSVEVDREGGIYVAWSDCRFRPRCATNDIVMSTSVDGFGWSAPTRVPIDNIDSGVDHFTPGLAVDPNTSRGSTRLAITYYYLPDGRCEQRACALNIGAVTSRDQGRTWRVQAPLNDAPMRVNWLPATNQGLMFGDYISTSFTAHGGAVAVVPVASAPVGFSLRVSMFAARLGP